MKGLKKDLLRTIRLILMIMSLSCFTLGCSSEKPDEGTKEETLKKAGSSTEENSDSDLDLLGFKVYDEVVGLRFYDVILKNSGSQTINTVSINVQYLDGNGDIVETSFPQAPARVQQGQSIAITGMLEENDNITSMTVDHCSFYTERGEYVETSFTDIPKSISLKESGELFFADPEEFLNSPINNSVKLGSGGDPLSIKNIQSNGDNGVGFIGYGLTVQNDTDEVINTISLNVIYLDDNGNISGSTYPQEESDVAPGQSITIEGMGEAWKYAYVTVDGYSYYTADGEYVSGYFSEIPQAIALGDGTFGTNISNSSEVKKAYDEANDLTVNNLVKTNFGYEYEGLSIIEVDREWIASPLNDKGTVEAGALYRSMASQLEGYSFIAYDSWKGSVVKVLFGFDKPETKEELSPYIDNVKDYIVLERPLKSVMNKLSTLSCIEGTINTDTGEYNFIITDLTQAANEMQITEKSLGYILAMVNEYGATVEFVGNSYSCKMVNPSAE